MMSDHLRVLSIGAGAIGTYIGGSLLLRGHKVVFIERPKLIELLHERGLHLNIGSQTHFLQKPEVTSSLDEALIADNFDVALFALKSFDTVTFLKSLEPIPLNTPPVLCLSNGVENEPILASALGSEKVIAGTVTSAIGRRDAGDIILERLRGVGVAAKHQLSERLVDVFDDAGLNPQLYPNAADMKWSKMLTNLIANATSAILDMPPAEIFAHPGLYRLEIAQLRETLAVMRAQNIHVVDLPGTPVRLLSLAVRYLPLSLSRPLLSKAVGTGRGDKMPSFHIDLHNGRGKSEVDYLNGAVVRAGRKLNIPTPVNNLLNTILIALTTAEIPLKTYRHQPDALLVKYAEYGGN